MTIPFTNSRLSETFECPLCPVRADLSARPDQTDLYRQTWPDRPVPTDLTRQTCTDVRFRLTCPGSPSSAVLFQHSFPLALFSPVLACCHVLTILSIFPVPDAMSWVSCLDYTVPFRLSCFCCSVLAVQGIFSMGVLSVSYHVNFLTVCESFQNSTRKNFIKQNWVSLV